MFGFRKKRRPDPSPPWLKWLVIGFLLFVFATNMHKGTPGNPNPVREAVHHAGEALAPQKLLQYENYKGKVFPQYEATLRVRDAQTGSGAPAVCGQQVKIAYDTFIADKPFDDRAGKDAPRAFRIGDGKVMPALEQGVIGMKKGGKRGVFSSSSMAYGNKAFTRPDVAPNTSVRFDIELLDISPALPDTEGSPYRIAVTRSGVGSQLQCGETAKVQVTFWSMDGKKLYSTQDEGKTPISFTPGKSEVLLGLDQGVIGMTRGEIRLLVIPPDFQKTMNGNAPTIEFPLPAKQTVLADVETVQ